VKFLKFAFAATLVAFATHAPAQDYPNKPVTMVVPFAAGGAGDILARLIGARLEPKWGGKPLVIENKTGAGGIIGAKYTAAADADGYTLMIAPSATMAVNVSLFKNPGYDPAADFVPLALAAQTPFVLVVNPDIPVKNVAEFIKWAKEQGGKLSYATAGPGVPHHLFAELFKSMTGVEMTPVAYRGSLPALNDVIAGHVPLMFVDLGPALGLIQGGKVRPIGISTKQRFAALPDVPPIDDTVKGFDAASWQMIVAPVKTPPAVVAKLHADLAAVLSTKESQDDTLKNGMLPVNPPMSVDALKKFVSDEIERWRKVVQKAGIEGSM
jgi:tripartite-type tricarboxylate transporter receptor subunit TctC